MSAAPVLERPGPAADRGDGGGGVPARRAVIRWALRLLRREWRQQLLILALITAAVVVTHDAQLAAWADRIVLLRDGRMTGHTTRPPGPESLLLPRETR